MAKSTKSRRPNKPPKPYPEFPLFPHATNRWAKKIRGKLHYFGPWNDPDAALQKYLDQKDALHAGLVPRQVTDGLTVVELCNRYLTSKGHLVDTQEITQRTFRDYFATCELIVAALGRNRVVEDLTADDFEMLRVSFAKTRGPVALGNEIRRTRMVFKYGFDQGLIDKPIRYGQGFKKPSLQTLRKARQSNGKRMFEADELQMIIEAASQPLRAMILLGINCGFGQSDVSTLPQSAIDFATGWIDFPRPKTGVERRVPLWTETIEVLRDAIAARPEPKNDVDTDLAFVTKYGNRWVKLNKSGTPDDAVGKEFAKLLKNLGVKRPGVSFYALRHGFETIAGESRDQIAVNAIMGHVDSSMAGVYRERISDQRLQDVVDVVHRWLFHSGMKT